MTLEQLLAGSEYQCLQGSVQCTISAVAYDSRQVAQGGLFICIRGFLSDGHQYIQKAIDAGAAAVIVEDASYVRPGATFVQVESSRLALALALRSYADRLACQRIIDLIRPETPDKKKKK